MKQLKDKVIFLTGGSESIGYEFAKAYASEGAKVAVANNATSVNEVVFELRAGHPGKTGGKLMASDVLPS